MAGPANDPPDAKMLELVSSEKTTPELTRESSSFLNDDGLKSNGPLTTALVHEENGARTSRESVLRRLSEALMRRSLAEVRSISASVLFFVVTRSDHWDGGFCCLVTIVAVRQCPVLLTTRRRP